MVHSRCAAAGPGEPHVSALPKTIPALGFQEAPGPRPPQTRVFNYRSDRTRQLCHALVDEDFDAFPRSVRVQARLTTMTLYEKGLRAEAAFAPR
ncbi:MAG: hypothetical protein ACE10G_13725, partial [Gemmatimonadales bacterium]